MHAHTPSSLALPDTQPGAALNEVLSLILDATPIAITEFVHQRYSQAYQEQQSISRRIGLYMEWHARGGFEIQEICRSEEHYIEVVASQQYSDDWWRLALEIDPLTGEISGVLLGRFPLPEVAMASTSTDHQVANTIVNHIGLLAKKDLFSGSVLIARHGQVLSEAAFGYANRDFGVANTVDTRFNVASLTKSWTATGICQLIEKGLLGFDTTLDQFLNYPDRSAASQITIEHLLTHTAGLGSYFTDEFDRTARKNMRSIDDYLALSCDQPLLFKPGSKWDYSNNGMMLLGKIIELISGQNYFDFIVERVLQKAGMKNAGFPELDFVNCNMAVGYTKTWTQGGLVWKNSLYEGQIKGVPAGCGYATARDVFQFAEAFKAGRLVSTSMAERMSSSKPALNSPDYGYGFAIHPERALFGHSGGLIGASANLDIFREPDGWVVVILANDLTMRTPVLKARQFIGLTIPERDESRSYLPHAGLVPR